MLKKRESSCSASCLKSEGCGVRLLCRRLVVEMHS